MSTYCHRRGTLARGRSKKPHAGLDRADPGECLCRGWRVRGYIEYRDVPVANVLAAEIRERFQRRHSEVTIYVREYCEIGAKSASIRLKLRWLTRAEMSDLLDLICALEPYALYGHYVYARKRREYGRTLGKPELIAAGRVRQLQIAAGRALYGLSAAERLEVFQEWLPPAQAKKLFAKLTATPHLDAERQSRVRSNGAIPKVQYPEV